MNQSKVQKFFRFVGLCNYLFSWALIYVVLLPLLISFPTFSYEPLLLGVKYQRC
jgi:hypothetical protein